jgi:hypothetical protein
MTNDHSHARASKFMPTAKPSRRTLGFLLSGVCLALANTPASAFDARGGQFVGFKSFSAFEKSPGARSGETVLTSPEIVARLNWDELIASWNAETPDGAYLKIEARAIYAAGPTKYYTMGLWSTNPSRYPRESVPHQKDADGDVATDTLKLKRPCDRLQLRLTLGGDPGQKPILKFLGLDLTDTSITPSVLPSNLVH